MRACSNKLEMKFNPVIDRWRSHLNLYITIPDKINLSLQTLIYSASQQDDYDERPVPKTTVLADP